MRLRNFVAGFPAMVILSVCLALPARGGDATAPFHVVPIELEVTGTRPIALEKNRLIMLQPDGERKETTVTLDEIAYRCRLLKVTQTETKVSEQKTLMCYELRAKDSSVRYAWSVWSYTPLGEFRLFSNQNGENYLAWVTGSYVVFSAVSRPADRAGRLVDFLAKGGGASGSVWVPVGPLVGRDKFVGPNASYLPIDVRSITKSAIPPLWTVEVRGTESDEVYTLVSDDTTELGWRLLQ